jgi:hypothetical protein
MALMTGVAWTLILLQLQHCSIVSGLYEDQVGDFDWHQSYLGSVKSVHFDQSSHSIKRIIISTHSNVLASINARTGQILWRRVLEKSGKIDTTLHQKGVLITVSRGGTIIRSWDPSSGLLQWEAATPGSQLKHRDASLWLNNGVQAELLQHPDGKGYIVAVLSGDVLTVWSQNRGKQLWNTTISKEPETGSFLMNSDGDTLYVARLREKLHVGFHLYLAVSGEEAQPSHTVSAPWLSFETSSCIINGHQILVCVDKVTEAVHWLSLKTTDKQLFEMVFINSLDSSVIGSSPVGLSHLGHVIHNSQDLLLQLSDGRKIVMTFDATTAMPVVLKTFMDDEELQMAMLGDTKVLFILSQKQQGSLNIQCLMADDFKELPELAQQVEMPEHLGHPKQAFVYLFHKKDKSLGYRMLLVTEEEAISLIQQNGRLLWTREESLANIRAVEVLDLPISTGKSHLENLFIDLATASGDPISLFIQRITVQLTQLQMYLSSLNGKQEGELEDLTVEGMSRDRFNLRKLIVVLTSSGKLFGIDSKDGQVHWQLYLSDLKPMHGWHHGADSSGYLTFVQRTSEHFPHPPQMAIVGSSKGQCSGSLLYLINPLTGRLVKPDPSSEGPCLPYKVTQAALLPAEDDHSMQVLLLIDSELEAHLIPHSTAALEAVTSWKQSVFIHTINCSSGSVKGYSLQADEFGRTVKLVEVWTVKMPAEESIVSYAARPPHEHVHAQALVQVDRSVLYKYLNPNLIAIATDTGQGGVSIYLIDSVTGSIFYHVKHRQVQGPIHMVHSENWFVYHLWNLRHRRYEVTVLDLYEGSMDRNDTHVSSLDPSLTPNILSQSYIFPAAVSTMVVTMTEKGITHKTVLFGLNNGAVLGIPKMILDARRTINVQRGQSDEIMIPPYHPQLELKPLDVLNYNQTVSNVKGLHTASTGLESTCLLFAHGLDLYSTQLTPSKTFDVLAEDFDTFLVVSVLLFLGMTAIVTARLAKRKLLLSQWR